MVTMKLFVLLVSHVAMVAAVAGCHDDRDKDHRPRKNCTAAGFSNVPAGLEPTTQVLLFPNNLFSSLSWSSFQVFTEIHEIDLTANKVPDVTPSVAPILPSLSVLRLGSNQLTSLPADSFSACPALTELYLENNVINSLSDGSFNGLSRLKTLDLTSNHIKVLPDLMLRPLAAIDIIYLESNKISVMPDDWFSKKEEVNYLFLSANPWACSCPLRYLHGYLKTYDYNVYVRDGPTYIPDETSVVCDSPKRLEGKPVIELEESDFCSPTTVSGSRGDFYQPKTTDAPDKTTTGGSTDPVIIVVPDTTTDGATPSPPPSPTTTAPTTTITTTTTATTTTITITATTTIAPTTTITTPAPPTTATPTFSTIPSFVELYTEHPRIVTWYQTFTRLIEWSDHSGSEEATEESSVELHNFSTRSTFTTSTEGPTKPAPVATTLTELPTTATVESTPSWGSGTSSGKRRRSKVAAAGVFCIWLFAGCFLLSAAAAACTVATLVRLLVWYRRVYRPLLTRIGGGVMMVTYGRTEQEEAAGGGVTARYRSVLFVHRDGGDGEERGVYRKTLYRLQSREEEVENWRDVMEECRVSREDGGRRGGPSRKRYSIILREERGEAGGGREELDWVVGGWEVMGGGQEEPRSSWGEWLTQYLPSMPWGVATPPEDKAAQ
ncbi:platelet glycoprotein Ib alpha chain [Amphiprion ocellaris]|uniref:LRRCT domain-containing protein n=1 Tax=Amphiprion ocellaris TaxID=80972 RepID=A0AAQ6A5G1_AMPOC|nr:platelet glycoprotein Ib alpha chain [Amphiprion ocellaris]